METAKKFLIVGVGGSLGAMTRFAIGLVVARFWVRDFPLATFLINVSGSLALGFFSGFAAGRAEMSPAWRLFVAVGFIGAYTTFSTFELETQRLTEIGAAGWAAANVAASVLVGFAAVRLGILLAR